MHACIHRLLNICMHACMPVCTHACTHACMHVECIGVTHGLECTMYIYMHACMHAYDVCIYACVTQIQCMQLQPYHVCIHACMPTCTNACRIHLRHATADASAPSRPMPLTFHLEPPHTHPPLPRPACRLLRCPRPHPAQPSKRYRRRWHDNLGPVISKRSQTSVFCIYQTDRQTQTHTQARASRAIHTHTHTHTPTRASRLMGAALAAPCPTSASSASRMRISRPAHLHPEFVGALPRPLPSPRGEVGSGIVGGRGGVADSSRSLRPLSFLGEDSRAAGGCHGQTVRIVA